MKKIIFIWSVNWSGSTLLDCMIGSGRDCFACGEAYIAYRNKILVKSRIKNKLVEKKAEGVLSPFWLKARKRGESELYPFIFSTFKDIDVISDSSKHIPYFKRQMKRIGFWGKYDLRHIMIYKHPLNYCYSGYRRHKKPPYNISVNPTWMFGRYKKYHEEFFSLRLRNPIFVSCERLTQNPADILQKICKELDIRYFNGKEQFWNFNHYVIGGGILVMLFLSKQKQSKNRKFLGKVFMNQRNRNKKLITRPMITYDDSWKRKLPPHFAKCSDPLGKYRKVESFKLYRRMENHENNIR